MCASLGVQSQQLLLLQCNAMHPLLLPPSYLPLLDRFDDAASLSLFPRGSFPPMPAALAAAAAAAAATAELEAAAAMAAATEGGM